MKVPKGSWSVAFVRMFLVLLTNFILPLRGSVVMNQKESHFKVEVLTSLNNCTVTRINDTQFINFRPLTHEYPLLNCTEGSEHSKLDFNLSLVPKDVQEMLFQFYELPVISSRELQLFPNLSSLYFRGDQISSFTKGDAGSDVNQHIVNIIKLSIIDSALEEIPTQFLQTLPNLSELELSHNNLSRIEDEDFSGNEDLAVISLVHNPLRLLDVTWLNNTPNLVHLDLRATQLTDVPYGFNLSKNLQFIDLSDNFIETVNDNKFSGLARLSVLLLSNNKITYIHKDALEGAYNIRYVDLTANKIERIESNIFIHLPGVVLTVELWENPIHCDGPWRWLPEWIEENRRVGNYPDIRMKCFNPAKYHGKRLRDMTPEDFKSEDTPPWEECINRIGEMPKRESNVTSTTLMTKYSMTSHFSTTPESTIVDENKDIFMKNCPARCKCYYDHGYTRRDHDSMAYPIVDCSNAKYVDAPTDASRLTRSLILSNNLIIFLNLAKLAHMGNLQYLELNDNQISEISCSLQNCVMENLQYFSASNNLLVHFSTEVMGNFPNLNYIHLQSNRFRKFPPNLFKKNKHLKHVYLGPNPLETDLPHTMIKECSVEELGLRGLNLKQIPAIIKNHSKLVRLELSDNEISVVESNSFEGCYSLIELSLENNNISLIQPNAFSSLPALRSLDLSENRLKLLNKDTFIGASVKLHNIELWQNPLRCDCNLLWLKDWIVLLEGFDPSTEIRFRCEQPARVHGKTSGHLTASDFVCLDEDTDYQENQSISNSDLIYSRKDLAIAIVCSILFTILAVFIIKCAISRLSFSRGGSLPYLHLKRGSGTESLTIWKEDRL